MNDNKQSILVVLTKSPYGSATAREALDAVLTAAAFEVPVSLLFLDDGVYQLLAEQQSGEIGAKSLAATLPVLPMYDVEHLYVDRQALALRGIDADRLIVAAEEIDDDRLKSLFQRHDRILSF